ncbi:MAG TPA: hypothetical protein H9976_03215 [Candidatus Akkermansia intestinavium]|nr:hypothetical protein [Candidatus Akkermansia intestinavium]
MKMKVYGKILLGAAVAGFVPAEAAGSGEPALPPAPAARASEDSAPPSELVLRFYQWLKVPDLPGRSPFFIHHIGVCSDGRGGGLGPSDLYIVAEYGGSTPDWRQVDGPRYLMVDVLHGHSPRLRLYDMDGDGLPELLVEYATPTDRPKLAIYSLRTRDAERHPVCASEGLSLVVKGLDKALVSVEEDGSVYLCDPWHPAEMKSPRPEPRRYVLRDGVLTEQPVEE